MKENIFGFSFKMGSRVLSEEELAVSIPNYRQIFEQIEMIRVMSANANPRNRQDKDKSSNEFIREFGKDYNNIFSILGSRGVGKTSLMLTIKNMLEKKNIDTTDDIILPMIVPEDMGSITDVLGWIIRYFEDVYKSLESELEMDYEDDEDDKYYYGNFHDYRKRGKISVEYDELFKLYLLRKEKYGKIINDKFIDLLGYIDDNKKIVSYDQELMYKFKGFIGKLIEFKKRVSRTDKEPLIFIFFDDVDMEPERCPEVFSTILKYLTHHSIVVFVNGNYSTFHEEISIEYMKKESLLNNPFLAAHDKEMEYIHSIKHRSHDYLKKVLPPSLRYEIPVLSDEDKANFKYTSADTETSKYKFYTLGELLEKCFCTGLDDGSNFLKLKGEFIYPYFKIFDETARGIINVYYYLLRMVLINGEGEFSLDKWDSTNLNPFLNTVIDSSTVLAKNKDIAKKVIKIFKEDENNAIPFFIDYEFLEGMFDAYNSDESITTSSKIEAIDEIIVLCLLGMFFEQSLIAINNTKNSAGKKEIKIHGCRILVKMLNSQNKSVFKLYPYISDSRELVYLYHRINKAISRSNIEFLFRDNQPNFFTMSYFKQLNAMGLLGFTNERKQQNISNSLGNYLGRIYNEDKQWVESRVDFIFKYGKTNRAIMEEIKENYFDKVTMVYEDAAFKEKLYKMTITDIFKDSGENEDENFDVEFFRRYVEKIFEEMDFNGINTDIRIADLEFLLEQFVEVYLLKDEIKVKELCLEIIKEREADIELLIKPIRDEFITYDEEDLEDIIKIDEKLRSSMDANTRFIENERRKSLWNRLQERYIYIPYDTSNATSNDEFYNKNKRGKKINYIRLAEMNPNEYIKEVYEEKASIQHIFNSGVLYIKEDDILDDNTQVFLKKYFTAKEENALIKAYLYKGLKSMKMELSALDSEFNKLRANRMTLEMEVKERKDQIANILASILKEKTFEQINHAGFVEELTAEKDFMQTIVNLNYYLYLNIEKRILGDIRLLKSENLSQLVFMYENVIENEGNLITKSKEEDKIKLSAAAMQTIFEVNELSLLNSIRLQLYNIASDINNLEKSKLKQLLAEIQIEIDRVINSGNTGEAFNLNRLKQQVSQLANLDNNKNLSNISAKEYIRKEMFLTLIEKSLQKYIAVECFLESNKISNKDAMNYFRTERMNIEKYVEESKIEIDSQSHEKNYGFLEYLKSVKYFSKSERK